MIKNEEYIDYLNKVISCVNHGDYYSVKELSVLKLDNLKKDTKIMEKQLNKYIKKNHCEKNLENLEKEELIYFVNIYVEYLVSELKRCNGLREIASIEEFIKQMN